MIRPDCLIVFDVGGTALKSVLGHPGGGPVEGTFQSTPMPSSGTREQIASAFSSAVREQSRKAELLGENVSGVAVAVPGPFDFRGGVFLMRHKFSSVYGERLQDLCDNQLPFRYIHDVNAALCGELSSWENPVGTVALVTIGTGLGFAYAVDGSVQESESGSPAESIYNLPFRDGILEDYVSRRGILDAYARISGHVKGGDVADIAALAYSGDKAACRVFSEMGSILGEGISPVLSRLGVDTLVLGGQISKSFSLFGYSLRNALPEGIRVKAMDDISGSAMKGAAALFS